MDNNDNTRIRLENISIILNKPRFPENIGAAARAAKNMGITDLQVISPENFDTERIMTLATHVAADIVENIKQHQDLACALAPFGFVVGTTARLGGTRKVVSSPRAMAEKLIPISRNNRIAIVFGPEDRGLTNQEIRLCHLLVTIPTADFSSINLAQAVMIICYVLHEASLDKPGPFVPRLATRHELDAMYAQLQELLVRIHFLQKDNPEHWMGRLRSFFSRLPLRAREVTVIRGICRQMNWYAKKCYLDGKAGLPPDPELGIGENLSGRQKEP